MLWRRWLILGVCLCWLGPLGLRAQPMGEPLALREATGLSLHGHLMQLHDPSGAREVAEVASGQAGAFVPMRGQLHEGFTPDAVWLRFDVQGADAGNDSWWLVMSNPLLEDIRFYARDAQGQWRVQRAGASAMRQKPLATDTDLSFRMPEAAAGVSRYYLRIQSRTSMVSEFTLLPTLQFARATTESAWGMGLLLGVYLLISLIYIALWWTTRQPLNAWYAVYVVSILGLTQIDTGWLQILLAGHAWFDGALASWLAILWSGVVVTEFNSRFLDLRRQQPRLCMVYRASTHGVAALGLLLLVRGHPQIAMKVVQPTFMLLTLFAIGMGGLLWRRGRMQGRFFVMAFGIFSIGVVLRLARNLDWFDFGWVSLHGYQIGTVVHVLLLSMGVFRQQKQWMRETEAARAQAASEQRLRQEQGMFMAMVSHEFRTPLGIIMATAENQLDSASLTDQDLARSQKILRAGQRLTRLLDNYLSVERLERAEASPSHAEVDMRTLCRDAVAEFEEATGGHVETTLPLRPLVCECDAGLIRIALLNLLHNAHRHSPAPGSVHLQLQDLGKDVAVRVRDQGAGIPEDELPLIFQRYFRGRAAVSQPGSGLGLYLVERILEKHAGCIEACNATDGGAEFCLSMPKRQNGG